MSDNDAEFFKKNLYRQLDNVEQVKWELEHIKEPYSIHKILDVYCSGKYSAELLLQHCLLSMIKNNFKFDSKDDMV